MLERGQSRAIASVKMCLDVSGHVIGLALAKSSGIAGWDRLLCERMRDWRYTPYLVNGAPTPVCTAITFIYQQHNDPPTPPGP